MAQFFHPYKICPEKPRAWTMEETKIPHRPNSMSRPSRRDFQRAVVVNPTFQRQFNDPTGSVDEEDMEPTLMEAPQAQGPRRVTKTENITVVRECEWDVKDTKDDSLGRRPPLNRALVLLVAVCLTSIISLVLTLLILSGSVGVRNCSCSDTSGFGRTSAVKSEDEDRIKKVSENITTLDKRMEERMQQVEKRILNERLLRNEMDYLRGLLKNQTARLDKLVNKISSQEEKIQNLTVRLTSTHRELETVREKADGLKNSSFGQFSNIWKAVNATAERTADLTNKVNDGFGHVQQRLDNSTHSLLRNISSLEILQSRVKIDMEIVWSNLNETRKSGDSLKSSFQRFKTNVTNRTQSLETRIEIEENNSNSAREKMELHLKKIHGLEHLLNVTREDIKKMSRNHSTALSLAGNFTRRQLHVIWSAINSTQSDLQGQLKKVKVNLTEQLNLTKVSLQSSDAFLFSSLININTTLTQKVNNISKMAGPIGPPGFNGSQGAAGPMGAIGPPGPKGAGNFSTCQYKVEEGVFTPGDPEKAVASKTETTGKIILGATCSTNFAPEHNLISQQQSSGKWKYICHCRGTSKLFSPQRGKTENCFLHYWECPLAT